LGGRRGGKDEQDF
jgi:hypothetical protein